MEENCVLECGATFQDNEAVTTEYPQFTAHFLNVILEVISSYVTGGFSNDFQKMFKPS